GGDRQGRTEAGGGDPVALTRGGLRDVALRTRGVVEDRADVQVAAEGGRGDLHDRAGGALPEEVGVHVGGGADRRAPHGQGCGGVDGAGRLVRARAQVARQDRQV